MDSGNCRFGFGLAGVLFLAVAMLTAGGDALAASGHSDYVFERIFNGRDLSGWDGDPRFWSVKDGVLRGETTKKASAPYNTFCIWRGGRLKNFVLKVKFRIQNGNSGIQYRSQDLGEWRISGYQAEICNQQGKVGFLYHEKGRGWLPHVGQFMVINSKGAQRVVNQVADEDALIKAGYYKEQDWNEYTIIARGNHIVHILNGFQTIELIDEDPKGGALDGVLALQIHRGAPMVVEFKDILVKHLPEHFGPAKLLFNNKDLDGWAFSSGELKDVWSVKDKALANLGKPRGYIYTTADYTNYVVRLQLRHITKGNSGVLLRAVEPFKVWPRSIESQGAFGNIGDIWNIDAFPMKTDPDRTRGRRTVKMHESNERPLGEWNNYEISLDGGELNIRVNGLLQNNATECWETPGRICIQSEGAQMEYRNIVLIPIDR